MKRSILLAILVFVCNCSVAQDKQSWKCVSAGDAQMLAGQPVKLVENVTETVEGVVAHLCTYVTTARNPETQQLGNVYSMAEEYKDAKAAQKSLADFVVQNKGMKKHAGIGDEAYSFTDGANFQLVMVRKGSKLVRIKINRVVGFTGNVDKLVGVAKGMAGKM